MFTNQLTNNQPVAALTRHILASLLSGSIGETLFSKDFDLEVLTDLTHDIVEGIEAGLLHVEESAIHGAIMDIEDKKYHSE